jgi:cold shock CspA family protein
MMATTEQSLIRIGVFYDGNFFFHVSNYYNYHHPRRERISISGLHSFIRQKVAEYELTEVRYCQIVDAHYFRGRLSAKDARERELLFKERIFDDVLVREGITTHYLPLGPDGEKGVDVWLALEAYELAIFKKFDVSVLVACDGDFLPLVRKLNTIGTRVMLLGWDFKYMDQNNEQRETRTAQVLLNEVTYPLMMDAIIDERALQGDPLIENLFVASRDFSNEYSPPPITDDDSRFVIGRIQNLKDGYGFITPDNGEKNLFFYYREVMNVDFNDLTVGDWVKYEMGENDRGPCAINIFKG